MPRTRIPRGYLTSTEVADILGISRQRVDQLRLAGRLPHKVQPMWKDRPHGQAVYVYPKARIEAIARKRG